MQDQPEKSKNKAICLYFVIAAQNVKNENISQATNPAHHRFSSKDADWGFSQAVSHAMLKKPAPSPSWNPLPSSPTKSTSLGDIMENESFKLKLFCKEVVDETGTLWMNFQKYSSLTKLGL